MAPSQHQPPPHVPPPHVPLQPVLTSAQSPLLVPPRLVRPKAKARPQVPKAEKLLSHQPQQVALPFRHHRAVPFRLLVAPFLRLPVRVVVVLLHQRVPVVVPVVQGAVPVDPVVLVVPELVVPVVLELVVLAHPWVHPVWADLLLEPAEAVCLRVGAHHSVAPSVVVVS